MSHTSDPRTCIRKFLAENFLLSDEEFPYADAASLLEAGVVDSTGVLELIQFLEETFGFRVGDSEATPANLDSVESLVAFVARKRATAGGPVGR